VQGRGIIVLSGPSGSGKTTTCLQLADWARRRGLDCAGLVCPARLDGTRQMGIDLLDLRTGERRPLAEADDLKDGGGQPAAIRTPGYRFDAAALAWGAFILDIATPCDLLIVDELGPLELARGEGWVNALDVLRAGRFRLAVVVVRPALLDAFRQAMPGVPLRAFTLPAPSRAV